MELYISVLCMIIGRILDLTNFPIIISDVPSTNNSVELQIVDQLKQTMIDSCIFNLNDDEMLVSLIKGVEDLNKISK